MSRLYLLLIPVLLAGCAPATHQALTRDYASKQEIRVDENYQSVYRRLQRNVRQCWETGLITAQMRVQSDLYSDIKEGNINVAVVGFAGVDTHLGIDIKGYSDGSTRVTSYNAMRTWNKVQPVIKAWAENRYSSCP
ncbi:hypothetical protein [Sansalvadorimonas verongulae]|uniref:hypothetical protein n=1 Tax=Sansalvadorimonas verongulae TaxID=2172824 RepID=UPI0012BB70E8|nr:hypothetical protein [Sansalvadorimonas verongulae]MTI13112.1 hypothetical protein [Sansalvadorimonas verongulae]